MHNGYVVQFLLLLWVAIDCNGYNDYFAIDHRCRYPPIEARAGAAPASTHLSQKSADCHKHCQCQMAAMAIGTTGGMASGEVVMYCHRKGE